MNLVLHLFAALLLVAVISQGDSAGKLLDSLICH